MKIVKKSLADSGAFAPDGDMARAMLATVLHHLEDEPDCAFSAVFRDVDNAAWYTKAVGWAASHGIVNGYGSGLFGPNDSITREQLAAMLYRYARYLGLDVTAAAMLQRMVCLIVR